MNLKDWLNKNRVPSLNYLTLKVKRYLHNKDWYKNSHDLIEAYYKSKSNLFIDILAMTSQRTTVRQNTINAIKTIENLDKLDKIQYGITSQKIKDNLTKYLDTGEFGGDKINQFADSLKLIDGSVCIDVWMLKAFNLKRIAPTYNDKKHITHIIKQIANKLNIKTFEVQACLWCYAKNELNGTHFKEYNDFTYYLRQIKDQTNLDNFIRGD